MKLSWCWCESVFHPSRRPFQDGRSRTLASRPYASRALANYAFALDGASRQASRLEPFLKDARSLFLNFPTSLQNRALRKVIFQKSDKTRCGSLSPDMEPPTISSKTQALSGSLAAHSSRSFDRCLLHWRPPCSALGRFLGRLYSTYSSCTPLVPSGPVIFLLSTGGYRQISTVTQFQTHPSGLLHWARGPCSRAAGSSLLLTGAILKAGSAGGLSGSFGRSVLKPKLLVAGLFFVPSSALFHRLK